MFYTFSRSALHVCARLQADAGEAERMQAAAAARARQFMRATGRTNDPGASQHWKHKSVGKTVKGQGARGRARANDSRGRKRRSWAAQRPKARAVARTWLLVVGERGPCFLFVVGPGPAEASAAWEEAQRHHAVLKQTQQQEQHQQQHQHGERDTNADDRKALGQDNGLDDGHAGSHGHDDGTGRRAARVAPWAMSLGHRARGHGAELSAQMALARHHRDPGGGGGGGNDGASSRGRAGGGRGGTSKGRKSMEDVLARALAAQVIFKCLYYLSLK